MDYCLTQRKQPVSSHTEGIDGIDGTSAPAQTWPSRVSARTADCQKECPWKVPMITTSAFPHNATEVQGSCPQRSSEAWNFHKVGWKRFCLFTDESVERLPPPDTSNIEWSYQDFCESLLSATKQCIPRGRWKNYVPCWDKECETLYHSITWALVGTDSDRAASSLLSQLGQNKQEQWDEPVNSINFLHSSSKAWRTINKLTGRTNLLGRLLSPVPCLRKIHRLVACEDQGT